MKIPGKSEVILRIWITERKEVSRPVGKRKKQGEKKKDIKHIEV